MPLGNSNLTSFLFYRARSNDTRGYRSNQPQQAPTQSFRQRTLSSNASSTAPTSACASISANRIARGAHAGPGNVEVTSSTGISNSVGAPTNSVVSWSTKTTASSTASSKPGPIRRTAMPQSKVSAELPTMTASRFSQRNAGRQPVCF
ncbi:unnamed protein product [Protopolystoma xenopodis]|uniref:Uncharacterized protein n=1 Tax=Protopolystoma xenopodis TaxID=117903 RepID=A0A3S5AKL2_9PLAT|nr:unnamed protein product [Protopolystoma xenopodis]